jgi:hypothetical protein
MTLSEPAADRRGIGFAAGRKKMPGAWLLHARLKIHKHWQRRRASGLVETASKSYQLVQVQ